MNIDESVYLCDRVWGLQDGTTDGYAVHTGFHDTCDVSAGDTADGNDRQVDFFLPHGIHDTGQTSQTEQWCQPLFCGRVAEGATTDVIG